jgi:hypothetical protein
MSRSRLYDNPALRMLLGLSTDALSDCLLTGPSSETYGEVRLSTSAPSSMPIETFTIPDDNGYEQRFISWKLRNSELIDV